MSAEELLELVREIQLNASAEELTVLVPDHAGAPAAAVCELGTWVELVKVAQVVGVVSSNN